MSGYLNWAVRSIADIEVQMTAVQRVYEYATIAPEQQANSGNNLRSFQLLSCYNMIRLAITF